MKKQSEDEIRDMHSLYVESLRDLYSAETQLIEALPKMAKAASSKALTAGFTEHLAQTKEHAKRLEGIFKELGEEPGGHHCEAMEGLIKEGAEMIQSVKDPAVLDAGLIGAAQKVEHYEISGYGTARTFATLEGFPNHATILQTTLNEEGATDHKLTELAESMINDEAEKTNEKVETRKKTGAKSNAKKGTREMAGAR